MHLAAESRHAVPVCSSPAGLLRNPDHDPDPTPSKPPSPPNPATPDPVPPRPVPAVRSCSRAVLGPVDPTAGSRGKNDAWVGAISLKHRGHMEGASILPETIFREANRLNLIQVERGGWRVLRDTPRDKVRGVL